MDVSFVLLQRVLALEPFPAALRFADEPGVSFAGFLVLLEAERKTQRKRNHLNRTLYCVNWLLILFGRRV